MPGGTVTGNRTWELKLIGGWQLTRRGQQVKVTLRQQRLIAVLALYGNQPRSFLAGLLWPNTSEKRAAGSLRESIWTVAHQLPGLLVDGGGPVGLAPDVWVDVDEVRRLVAEPLPDRRRRAELLGLLRNAELLLGWYEDWATAEQERWKQLRLSVLERFAEECLADGETAQATEAAACAIAIEPLRESAQRLLIEAHLAEGNYARSLQLYEEFKARLRKEFGVAPSSKISGLMEPLLHPRPAGPPVLRTMAR